jgi:hypothetical protein
MGTSTQQRHSIRSAIVLANFCAAFLAAGSGTVGAQGEIFVADGSSNAILVYVRTANGNVGPVHKITSSTDFNGVSKAAPDPVHNEVAVTNCNPGSVLIFSLAADGDVAPLRTISGAATGLTCAGDVIIDTVNDEILVTDEVHSTLSAFARTASGNVAPLRVLQLATSVVAGCEFFALDTVNNELAVTSYSTNTVAIFSRTASALAAPLRVLTGAATGLSGPQGVAIDAINNELMVVNTTGFSLATFARTANGNTGPLRTIAGGSTGLIAPVGLASDVVNGELVVSNNFLPAPSVLVFARAASGNVAPARTLAGVATELTNPIGVAVFASPTMTGVVSRRTHGLAGPFDLPLSTVVPPAVNHNPTTEPRQGPTQTIVFTFDMPVNAATAAITEGTATAGAPTFSGSDVTVPLTGVSNQQYVTVTLSGVSSTGGAAGGSGEVRVGFLAGDVNQTRVVSVADLGLVNAQLAQPVSAANFLKDVNASGTLTVADKGITNADLTKALPAP